MESRNSQTEKARNLFKDKGLSYQLINKQSIESLFDYIKNELPLVEECEFPMQLEKVLFKDFKYDSKGNLIKGYIKVKGSYFSKREAISFNENGFIGFAGWADRNNVKPFTTAFTNWIDTLTPTNMITEKDLPHIQEGYAIQEGFESHEHAMNSLSDCRNPVLLSEYINGMLSVEQASEMSEFEQISIEDINSLINYFGKSDKTLFEQRMFWRFTRLKADLLATPPKEI